MVNQKSADEDGIGKNGRQDTVPLRLSAGLSSVSDESRILLRVRILPSGETDENGILQLGDLTIGDFWGIERFDKKLDVEHGVSILQANTEKGKMILSSLKESMAYYPVEWERYRKTFGNSLAKAGGIPMNPKRVAFLQSVREKGFHRAVRAIYPLHRDAALFRIGTIKKKVKTMIRKEQGIRS